MGIMRTRPMFILSQLFLKRACIVAIDRWWNSSDSLNSCNFEGEYQAMRRFCNIFLLRKKLATPFKITSKYRFVNQRLRYWHKHEANWPTRARLSCQGVNSLPIDSSHTSDFQFSGRKGQRITLRKARLYWSEMSNLWWIEKEDDDERR